jgi:methionyl-tRNA synthetase
MGRSLTHDEALARSFATVRAPLDDVVGWLLASVRLRPGFGELVERHRQKAALAEAMRTVAEVNKYVSDMAPWKLKGEDERERLSTVLHVTTQAVADCNMLLSPFLPHSANVVDRVFGGAGDIAPMPQIREVDDLDGGPPYPILTGDYSRVPTWGRRPVQVGTPVEKPTPVFTKLDDSVVDDELARLEPAE